MIDYYCSKCGNVLNVKEEKTNTEGYINILVKPCDCRKVNKERLVDMLDDLKNSIEDIKDEL